MWPTVSLISWIGTPLPAEHLAEFLEEVIGVGRRKTPELRRADPGIDPVLCLANERFHCVRIPLDRLKPVLDAQLNGTIG